MPYVYSRDLGEIEGPPIEAASTAAQAQNLSSRLAAQYAPSAGAAAATTILNAFGFGTSTPKAPAPAAPKTAPKNNLGPLRLIPMAPRGGSSPAPAKSNTTKYLVIGGVALAAIGAAFYFRKKRGGSSPTTSEG